MLPSASSTLSGEPRPVVGAERVFALNIDPEAVAIAYRERGQSDRGVLPDAAVRSIEEQLSGACTVESAAFDEHPVQRTLNVESARLSSS